MKPLAILAAAGALFASASLGSAASTTGLSHGRQALSMRTLLQAQSISASKILSGRVLLPMQSGGTPAPSGTAVPSPTAGITPTPTANPYPDPVNIFQTMIQVYTALKSSAFQEITDGEQKNVEKLHIAAKGKANCSGPSMSASATGTDTLEGTSQTTKAAASFIEIKNKAWTKSSATKNKWVAIKPAKVSILGFSVDNPLACAPATSGSGSGSGSGSSGGEQLKQLVNLGPDTISGVKVWHIQGSALVTASDGSQYPEQLDFYVSQDHFLLYKFSVTVDDTQHGVTLTQSQILSKFGQKFTIKAPKT